MRPSLEGAQGIREAKDPTTEREIDIAWLGAIEVDFPESEGESNKRVIGMGRDEYVEWRGKDHLKRRERKDMGKIESEMRSGGLLDEEEFFAGALTIMGWDEDIKNEKMDQEEKSKDEMKNEKNEKMKTKKEKKKTKGKEVKNRNECETKSEQHELENGVCGMECASLTKPEMTDPNEFIVAAAKHKTVDQKVRPVAVPLPMEAEHMRENVTRKSDEMIGTTFTPEKLASLQIGQGDFLSKEEDAEWRRAIASYGKAFAYTEEEKGCVDPSIVPDMVIWTVPHTPWSMRPLRIPQAWMGEFTKLLKAKISSGVLEKGYGPYSNRWFCVRKKNGKLRLIQDLQPANRVTIRDLNIPPEVDGFAERFAGRSIYTLCDLYSGYDQFPLAPESRDLTAIQTPLGLYRMTVTPMGGTNSVAHFQRAMCRVLERLVPDKVEVFVDDIGIKGSQMKDETEVKPGIRKFVWEHLETVQMVLDDLVTSRLTLSPEKSLFAQPEMVIVGHLCNAEGRLPERKKVEAITQWKPCTTLTEVRGFLGACLFFRIWIKDLATIAEPLFRLLRKGVRFTWGAEQTHAMEILKRALITAPILRPPDYGDRTRPLILATDASPYGSGWMLGQDDENGRRFACRYGSKTFNERERRYSQIKRELLSVCHALKRERHYLLGQDFILEVDASPLIGVINNPDLPDLVMGRWVAYIKTFAPTLRAIPGKKNIVPDALSHQPNHIKDGEEFENSDLEDEIDNQLNVIESERGQKDYARVFLIETEYTDEFLKIGHYLETLMRPEELTDSEYRSIRRKAQRFYVRDGHLFRKGRPGETPRRVVCDRDVQKQIIREMHDAHWAGHRSVGPTFSKIRLGYFWPGMWDMIRSYVETCEQCQKLSHVQHREELHPSVSPIIHGRWNVDIVVMPHAGRFRYLILAREDITDWVEGRALHNTKTKSWCTFIFEEIVCRYGTVREIVADRGELASAEATEFFNQRRIQLRLTTAYNLEANSKAERGHPSIVQALIKSTRNTPSQWPSMLHYALWADRTTAGRVRRETPYRLMFGQNVVYPIETSVTTWAAIEWSYPMSREELLEARIRQLERRSDDLEIAKERIERSRALNKEYFDITHHLRPLPLKRGDFVIISDETLKKQWSRKFDNRWLGPYVVETVHDNGSYSLNELDGTPLRIRVAGKRVKLFKRRVNGEDIYNNVEEDDDNEEMEESEGDDGE